MRTRAALLLSVLLAAIAPAHAARPHPVALQIASIRGQGFPDDTPGGNVLVKLSNGHRQRWTRSGHCLLPKLAKSGLVGWTYGPGKNYRGMWMNGIFRVARHGRVIREFHSAYAFIEQWDFADNDKSVILESRGAHGPCRIEKYSITTGELLGDVFGIDLPDWAKPYGDERFIKPQ